MTLRVVITVGEIPLLVLVLAYFLRILAKLLARAGDNLHHIADGVRAIEGHCGVIGPGTDRVLARPRPTSTEPAPPRRPSPPEAAGSPAAPVDSW